MDALECILSRRTIRRFTEQPVEFDKIATLMEAGVHAPTSGNVQNFRFILVTEKGILQQLYEYCMRQEQVYNAQFAVVIVGEEDKIEALYGLRGRRLYSIQNCACAAENMLLAAHALGFGGCWIGAFDEDKVRGLLSIEDHARPQLILVFGYPDEEPVVERKALESFVNFNRYALKVKDVDMLLRDFSNIIEKNVKAAGNVSKKKAEPFIKRFKEFLKTGKEKK